MIKINSISGVVRYVRDLDAAAAFYESIGFRVGKRDVNALTCYVNWFWVELRTPSNMTTPQSTTNEQLAVSVEGIDDLYKELQAKGIHTDGEPTDQPWGRREFIATDPDGYTLLFFKKG